MAYQLVSELFAHSGPVRSLAIGPSGEIVSGCQADAPNIRRWKLVVGHTEDGALPELSEVGTAIQHDHWVTAVTSLSSASGNEMYPEGCIITGCKDNKIRIFSRDGEPMMVLEGHTGGVISFSWSSTGKLISGSWDGTAKIWDLAAGGVCVETLGGHENGVNVLGMSNGQIITTSSGESVNDKPANFQIRFWDEVTGKQVGSSVRDHDGSIRSVAALPGICAFATTSNDGSVRVRSDEDLGQSTLGVCYHPLSYDGTPPFVLHVTALHSNQGMCDFVSCGEDGSVVVWNGGFETVQVLQHPACAWCALAIPNTEGDFITAGHDGVIRLFSKNPDFTSTIASSQLQSIFESQVQEAATKRKTGPSSEELAKCPKWDERGQRRGRSEGDVCVFNKDGKMIAAQWSAISSVWIEVGEVTGSGDSDTINGVRYDHVMPVEMEGPNGLATLQLGYNDGENPFIAAARFIDMNGLGPQYTKQIADWIQQRAGRNAPTIGSTPSSSSSGGSSSSSSTGSRSGVPPPAPGFSFSPQAYMVFDDVPSASALDKIVGKITEFNMALVDASSPNAFTALDLETLDSLLKKIVATSQYHVSVISNAHLAVLAKAARWDAACAFPAFDILRMVCVHPGGAVTLSAHTAVQAILDRAVELTTGLASGATTAATALTALRFLCNAFRHDAMRETLLTRTGDPTALFAALVAAAGSGNANKLQRSAMSTIALNFSFHFATAVKRNPEVALRLLQSSTIPSVLDTLNLLLSGETEATDVIFKSLKALGTILSAWQLGGGSFSPSTMAGAAASLAKARSRWGSTLDAVALRCLDEVSALLA